MGQFNPSSPYFSEPGRGVPDYALTNPMPQGVFERRTELRDPEITHLPLSQVVDRLTTPEAIEQQTREYAAMQRNYEPYSADAKEVGYYVELMDGARRNGRSLFVAGVGIPEIDVVRRGLEDAPRSAADELDHDTLSRATKNPDAAVLLRGEVFVRSTDIVPPAGGFTDSSISAGRREIQDLQNRQEKAGVRATAIVAPDGSVVYIYRDGNISHGAVASVYPAPVRLTQVEVVVGDPREITAQQHRAYYEARAKEVADLDNYYPYGDGDFGEQNPEAWNRNDSPFS